MMAFSSLVYKPLLVMYAHLTGTVVKLSQTPLKGTLVVLEVNGIGYLVHTVPRTASQLATGQTATLYTHLVVQETVLDLIGFTTVEERDLFTLLIQASGVGARVALAILSDLSVSEIVQAIVADQHKILTTAKGVGPKLAQKLVLELREKMAAYKDTLAFSGTLSGAGVGDFSDASPLPAGQAVEEAQAVLLSLGYSPAEVHASLKESTNALGSETTAEAYLQRALQWLAQQV